MIDGRAGVASTDKTGAQGPLLTSMTVSAIPKGV
jgi:hypothetical protein